MTRAFRRAAAAGARDRPIPSPNIWHHPQVYEVENRAVDRAGALTSLMRSLAPWAGRDVLDVGCGTGFHLPMFAEEAASVTGVEPHGDLAAIARRRHVDVRPHGTIVARRSAVAVAGREACAFFQRKPVARRVPGRAPASSRELGPI